MYEEKTDLHILLDINITEDTAGILFALGLLSEVQLDGISLCFGRSSLASTHKSLSGLLKLLENRKDTPVALGAEGPWRRDHQMSPAEEDISHAINGLLIDTEDLCSVSQQKAAEFLYEKLVSLGEKSTTLLCAGPLTNIADLLEYHPDAEKYIKELIWCGGTQRHAQLLSVMDYHTWLDPEAAAYVLEQGLNFTMCPVDIGLESFISQKEIDAGIGEKAPVIHQFNRLLKKRWCDLNAPLPLGQRNLPLPIPELAAVAAAVSPSLCRREMRYGAVDLKGRLTFGMLVIDINNRLNHKPEEMNIAQVCQVDRQKLVDLFYTSFLKK